MLKTARKARTIDAHPCLSEAAHGKFSRIHMPVAPACNIECGYCVRKYDCANESRPGVTSRVLGAWEAMERVSVLMERTDRISVIGIAGPGEALANDATFDFLSMLKSECPETIRCISTNGLLLPERLGELLALGVESIKVTANAISPETAARMYEKVRYGGTAHTGSEGASLLLNNQWRGIIEAVKSGVIVKLNTIYIPGVNEAEIPMIAARAGAVGVNVMNIMPLIPQARFLHVERPSCLDLDDMRARCGTLVAQMTHCRQCRADAFGALGEDGDMELELVNASIGEDYCEAVV